MNEYVKNYLAEHEKQREEEFKKDILKLSNYLRIGDKEYPEGPYYNLDEYPYREKNKNFRYSLGQISKEEYEMLLKTIQDEENSFKKTKLSGWHRFATFMIILGGIAVAIIFIMALSKDKDKYWDLFLIVIGSYLLELGFWAIIQLLAKIKQNTDSLLKKQK